ncbi:hypothetical protein [Asaia lannensis]|uniref:hypothetical protein n=1 Tax=Asaia lannensis TaxID=415421 RepID=UPI0038735C2F
MHDNTKKVDWNWLILGVVTATFLPIGIHTIMLDNLNIPYPAAFPREGWASLPDRALRVFSMLVLCGTIRANARLSTSMRFLIISLAVAALNEALLRLPIMRNVVSTHWTIYPFVDNLPEVIRYAALAIVVMAITPYAVSVAARAASALVIAICVDFILAPYLGKIFAPLIAANASREGDQLYTVPYDWHVDLPSYLTFAEPAIAALLLAWLLAKERRGMILITLVLFGMRAGPLFGVALNVFYAPSNAVLAVLSKGQFALESAALALIAAAVMTRLHTPSNR